jgi:hypothetical protein
VLQKALNVRPAPANFTRLHFEINGVVFRGCRSPQEYTEVVQGILRALGIQKEVVLASKIGNSILELYVALPSKDTVINALKDHYIPGFDPAARPVHAQASPDSSHKALVKRLTYLYKKARYVKLKECILQGFSPIITSTVLNEYQKSTDARQ